MHIVLIVLGVIIAIIALFLIVAAFVKKDYALAREVVINKPLPEVFAYILQLKNQAYFNKWWMVDPNAKQTFTGTDGTVGFLSAWDSENKQMGKGEQEILKIVPGERIESVIRFERPFKNVGYNYMAVEAVSTDQTRVIWGFSGAMPYPMNMMLLFLDMGNLLGKDILQSLGNLKTVLEKS